MDGVVIIDKPAGLTSHDVVARVRRTLGEKRVGHTGTLDPFATGVLVVLVGRATRLAQFLSGGRKEYEGVIRFGYATDTGDATGKPVSAKQSDAPIKRCRANWSEMEIESALESLRGEIEQVPPMYSAKKVQGRKLYELARRGEEIERKAVRVRIYEFETVQPGGSLLRDNQDGTCDLSVRVVCSAGTYIRALAEQVGERLGERAHLAALRRTRAGDFKIEDALKLEELKERAEAGAASGLLISMNAALSALPFVHLTTEEARRARHGMGVNAPPPEAARVDGERLRMLDERGELIAIGVYERESDQVQPRVVLAAEK
ncbi:MAG: tRNA pseudouridine(55) synthase TruB [Pyrinomonadaceae bacterium]